LGFFSLGLINIIGAGPVGLHCGTLLAEEGFEVTIFEEHQTVGRPVQCAGLISRSGIEELGVELGNSVINEVKGAKIFSPNGESLTIQRPSTVAYVVDRFLFDQMFYKKAKRLGCEIKTDCKLIDIRAKLNDNSSLFLQNKGRGELIKSKITIGADGANSVVRHSVFPGVLEKEFVHAIQIRAEGKFNPDLVEMHFGDFAPGFFAWVVPESKRVARIGLAVSLGLNAGNSMKQFLEQKQFSIRTLSKSSALIPISPPLKEISSGNILLVGDAAGHTKATTGGGIVFGLRATEACADTIANHLKHQHSLDAYSKNMQGINKELNLHWKLHSYIQAMKPGQFNSMLLKAKNAGIEEFLQEHGDMDRPSSFMKKVLFKPKMWGLLPAVIRTM